MKGSVNVHFPNIRIVLPLAATNKGPGRVVLKAILVARKTLTSAPVSSTNWPQDMLFHMKTRPSTWLDAMTPTDTQPVHFLAMHTAAGICNVLSHAVGGCLLFGLWWCLQTPLDDVSYAALKAYIRSCWQNVVKVRAGSVCILLVYILISLAAQILSALQASGLQSLILVSFSQVQMSSGRHSRKCSQKRKQGRSSPSNADI